MAKQQVCWCAPHKDSPALGTSYSDSDWTKGLRSIYWTYLARLTQSFSDAVPVSTLHKGGTLTSCLYHRTKGFLPIYSFRGQFAKFLSA